MMMNLVHLVLLAAYAVAASLAVSLRVQIPASHILPNPNALPASTHATLLSGSGPSQRAVLRRGAYLDFPNINTTGTHLLDIYSHNYVFAPYRIDIAANSTTSQDHLITGAFETYRGVVWSDHGNALIAEPSTSITITAKVLGRKEFYEQRQGFNLLSLLKNPMLLLGGVALLFVFVMPKLMENMDPEMKAEYEEMQKTSSLGSVNKVLQGGGAGDVGGFDLASYLAGRGSGTSGTSSTSGADTGAGAVRERRR